MKLLHVITTLDVGGAEMHLLSQVRGQAARGHQVRVAYLKGEGRLTKDFLEAGAEWVGFVGGMAAVPMKLFSHLRWAEIVHSHLLKADMVTAPLATMAGRRKGLVSGKHNDEQVLKRSLVSTVHGMIGRLPRQTIVLSDHVGRFVEEHGRVPQTRQTRIYYGLNPKPFQAASEMTPERRVELREQFGFGPNDVVFLCVARFAAQKAHDVLLKAIAKARAEAQGADGQELRLLLVGGDPFGDGEERAKALAEELNLGGGVHFAGIRRDVPDLMALSDVFVMSSLWEGLGLVFLEAMATGLPVLSTRVSAIPEVVVEGETGRLVEPAQVDPLAAAMLEMARDPEGRAAMGQAGRTRVLERFGLDRMVDETLEAYAKLLAS